MKVINLALQGGGAHGAFTWGVLERLLEDERLQIEGISATSAGAINAAVLAHGFLEAGRDGAVRALHSFWKRLSEVARLSPIKPTLIEQWLGLPNMDWSPGYLLFDLLTRVFSPHELNPFNWDPLRALLEQAIDFERLRRSPSPKLFICATNVRSGKIRIFDNEELSAEVLLASACLPVLQRTIEIGGEAYWDGGYMGNPALFPLIYNCSSRDVVIVQINPIRRKKLPVSARAILNRINEISFNSSLMREMRAIAFVTRLLDEGLLQESKMKKMLIHIIEAEELMAEFGFSSKLNASWDFLHKLRAIGQRRAELWIRENFEKLGSESTVNISERFM